ncbi:hypothetical protein D3C71_732380 [compost metagenome]
MAGHIDENEVPGRAELRDVVGLGDQGRRPGVVEPPRASGAGSVPLRPCEPEADISLDSLARTRGDHPVAPPGRNLHIGAPGRIKR